jgi:LPS sulfotransferase NodH
MKSGTPALGIGSFWTAMEPGLDFPHSVLLRKSYIIASSYRCGSTFLCSQLWSTGVLGAPAEYLNIGATRMSRDIMMGRLRVRTPEEYFKKLLACRTSGNGVFGIKVHFPDLEAAMLWYPPMLRLLSPTAYIYFQRRDKLAQAVSMAKAIQTNAWQSLDNKDCTRLVYDAALIAQCLKEIQRQNFGWVRWFETNNVKPFSLYYEDLVADPVSLVRKVAKLLDVQNDKPDKICLPVLERQADQINADWISRFRRERDKCIELEGDYSVLGSIS